MPRCPLKFNNKPIGKEELCELIEGFRERGFAIVKDVFKRNTVDAFLNRALDSMKKSADGRIAPPSDSTESIWPATAPRIRQLLVPALSHSASMRRMPVLYETTWHIATEQETGFPNERWHCDIDPEGMPGNEYHFPREVHVGLYFADMSPKHGPTEVLPGSHRRSPRQSHLHSGPTASFLCKKQDVVLWDQRLWHRATRRILPGPRIFAVYGFCAAPAHRQRPRPMPAAQYDLWTHSEDPKAQLFFGGPFLPKV